MRKRTRRACFTLIELLVVIAILAILAVLTIPALIHGVERSREARCKKNLRNLQMAAMNYAIDHDQQRLPYARDGWELRDADHRPPNWNESRQGWLRWHNFDRDASASADPWASNNPIFDRAPYWGPHAYTSIIHGTLYEYTGKTIGVYVCPTFQGSEICGDRPPSGGEFSGEGYRIWRSYVMNPKAGGTKLGDMEASRTLLFAEIAHVRQLEGGKQIAEWGMTENGRERGWDGVFDYQDHDSDGIPWEAIGFHHEGRGNAVFIDGHVESMDPEDWQRVLRACEGRL